MSLEFGEINGLYVEVNEVMHVPTLDAPADKPHPFVYFLTISNRSKQTVTIRGRKWVVRESNGETVVVEGSGVVGQTPRIEPGDHFSYNSYHVVAMNARVEGSFFGVTAKGRGFRVRIPGFDLEVV